MRSIVVWVLWERQEMRRWQYKTLDWGDLRKLGAIVTGKDFVDENVDAGLNKLGEEGWELVGVYVDGFVVHRSQSAIDIVSISRYVKFTFKRLLENEQRRH